MFIDAYHIMYTYTYIYIYRYIFVDMDMQMEDNLFFFGCDLFAGYLDSLLLWRELLSSETS